MPETCCSVTVDEHEEDIVNNGVVLETCSVTVDEHEEDIDDDKDDNIDIDIIDDKFELGVSCNEQVVEGHSIKHDDVVINCVVGNDNGS